MNYNPYIVPYNMMIGSYANNPIRNSSYNLKEKMRQVWEQHVFWTRLLIVSITEHLKDESVTTTRLLRNPNDLAEIYRHYYGNEVAKAVADLITEHLVIGAKLIHALAENNNMEVNKLDASWYKNADQIAEALSSINQFYNKEELRRMLYTHLDLTKEEVTNRVKGNYKKEIEVFDNVEKEIIMMSDYLTNGINKQFI